jgi:hypothetical protein
VISSRRNLLRLLPVRKFNRGGCIGRNHNVHFNVSVFHFPSAEGFAVRRVQFRLSKKHHQSYRAQEQDRIAIFNSHMFPNICLNYKLLMILFIDAYIINCKLLRENAVVNSLLPAPAAPDGGI